MRHTVGAVSVPFLLLSLLWCRLESNMLGFFLDVLNVSKLFLHRVKLSPDSVSQGLLSDCTWFPLTKNDTCQSQELCEPS